MQNLKNIKEQLANFKDQLARELKLRRPSASKVSFYQGQITRLNYLLSKFGSKFNVVYVKVTYQGDEGGTQTAMIYYTDITTEDAEQYVRDTMEGKFKILEVMAFDIQPGQPIKMV